MRYENSPLLPDVADEYVVGTLRGRARRRFEAVLQSSDPARSAARSAEDRLLTLSLALEPVQPSPAVWDAITVRLGMHVRPDRNARLPGPRWRLALAAMLAMFALGIAWFLVQPTAQPTAVANLGAEGGPQLWAVQTFVERGRLNVKVTSPVEVQPGRSYELWALPEGGAPVSLGLMPEAGELRRTLSQAQLTALGRSTKVAVSLEPEGGSRTGAPTGPVLYVAELRVSRPT